MRREGERSELILDHALIHLVNAHVSAWHVYIHSSQN